jgi:AcrR family transcriptional regulator
MDAAKKDCILVEAAKAFARWGFKKTSVDDIAKGAGVAKGTVYLACESKEDLFFQVVQREVRAWVAEVAKLLDPAVPADELLAKMSMAGVAYLETHPLVQDLLFGKTSELLPSRQERFRELRTLGTSHVVAVLKLGVKQGIFRPELDCEEVASLLQDLQLTTYLFHNHGADRDARFVRRGLAGFDLVLNGLRVEHGNLPKLPAFTLPPATS